MDAPMGAPTSTGIGLSTSTCASGPTFYGSRKEVPKDDRMNIGVGLSISRHSDPRPRALWDFEWTRNVWPGPS
jgi:hypothetical protein